MRRRRASKRPEDFIAEVTSLDAGDLVVHVDHGIGRFVGLQTIEAAGAPHDCLELHYAEGAKLYLPVENIELLSRYGSEEAGVQLDKLGGVGWQTRKARLKNRIREMAGELIKIAAARQLREAPRSSPSRTACTRSSAPASPTTRPRTRRPRSTRVLDDLGSGKPMDRLVCGDVGFGKTEVALRAAFIAAMSGKQVAVVVPTTLLARQHFKTFTRALPRLSREGRAGLAAGPERRPEDGASEGLADGTVDIVVGTHALLGKADQVQGPRPAGGRRGAALRRRRTRRSSSSCAPRCMC